MTKEEFQGIVKRTLDEFQKEYKIISAEEDSASILFGHHDQTAKDLRYKKYLLLDKIMKLENLIKYPAYSRIIRMSTAEVTEYSAQRLEEIEKELSKLDDSEKENKEKTEELTNDKSKLIKRYADLDDKEAVARKVIKDVAKKIVEDIGKQNLNLNNIIVGREKLLNEKKILKSGSAEEIRQFLLTPIIKSIPQDLLDKKEEIDELAATLGEDPKKVEAAEPIYSLNNTISQNIITGELSRIHLPNDLADFSCNSFVVSHYMCSPLSIQDLDELNIILNEYLNQLNDRKTGFNCHFKRDTLHKLVDILLDKQSGNTVTDADLLFLNSDTIISELSSDEINKIIDLRQKYIDLLTKKENLFINKRKYDEEIKTAKREMYLGSESNLKSIINKYIFKVNNYFGTASITDTLYREYTHEYVDTLFDMADKYFDDRFGIVVLKLKKEMNRIREELNKKEEEKQKEIGINAEKIKSIAEIDSKDIEYKPIPEDKNPKEEMNKAAVDLYVRKLMDRVDQIAELDAEKKEAEILGISLEELRIQKSNERDNQAKKI